MIKRVRLLMVDFILLLLISNQRIYPQTTLQLSRG